MIHPEIPSSGKATPQGKPLIPRETLKLLVGRFFVRYQVKAGQPEPRFFKVLGVGDLPETFRIQPVGSYHDPGIGFFPAGNVILGSPLTKVLRDSRESGGDLELLDLRPTQILYLFPLVT